MKKAILTLLMLPTFACAQERPRVYVKPIPGGDQDVSTAKVEAEIVKRCPNLVVTEDKDKATYILDYSAKGNTFVVFKQNGDLLQRGGALIFHTAIENACKVMK
jgi:hypothetical protein